MIHPDRIPAKTPEKLVDEQGKAAFGTFETEFEEFALERARGCSRLRLTQWPAVELFHENGIVLCALCDMGLFGKLLHVNYNTNDHSVQTWDQTLLPKKVQIAKNLKRGNESHAETKSCQMTVTNLLDRHACRIQGKTPGLDYDLKLKRLAKPSIVSIPFPKNKVLYTQKDWFQTTGTLTIDGKKTGPVIAVLDDHRGYYPYRMHYDWICTMTPDFAINLTRNQSTDQNRYNENLLWTREKNHPLPPVTFHKEGKDWHITSEDGTINLKFELHGDSPMVMHAGIIDIDYHILFGHLTGTIQCEDGTIQEIDHPAIAEDKTMRL